MKTFLLLVALAAPALAQDPLETVLEEVKVTADFRVAGIQRTATSVSVIDDEIIRERSAQHLDDLLGLVPNLNFAGGTSRARFFQIRGIGERSQFGEPLNPSVGYVVDDVDFSGIGNIGTLLDVDQVEVFKGPQGTRYGANALAGLIYIKTRDPEPFQSTDWQFGIANYGQSTLGLVHNQPLADNASLRLAFQKHQGDGYYKNAFLGRENTNKRDEVTLRAKLSIVPSDDWRILAGVTSTRLNNGYDTFSLDNTRTTQSDQPGHDNQDATALYLKSVHQEKHFDVQLIGGFADSALLYSYDEDWTFTGFHPFGYSSFDSYERDKQVLSLESRLVSSDEGRWFNQTTDWVLGLYSLQQKENLERQYTFLDSNFGSRYDFNTIALFAQFDTTLDENLTVSYGARVEQRNTTYSNTNNFSVSPTETLWGGRVALKYFPIDRTMVYASLARGFKAGGFNTDGTLPPNLRLFDSETLLEVEVGIKSRMLSNQLEVSAALFQNKRRSQQVKSSFVRPRPDGSTEFVDFLGNAARGTNSGLETQVLWLINSQWRLNVGVGLLSAEFDRFVNEFGEDLAGRDQSQAPDYSYSMGINWRRDSWQINLDLQGKDSFFFSDRHNERSTRYTLVNAGIIKKWGQTSLHLWGRNLTNRDVTVRGFGSFGNDPRKGYQTEAYVQYGEPRIVGLTLKFKGRGTP